MSIRPVAYNEVTKIYTMLHEELNHQYDILLNDITFASDSGDFFNVVCFICDGNSIHPASGGAIPPDIQLLHSRLIQAKDCTCGLLPAGKTEELCLSHSKLHCSQLDGIERWQVEQNAGESLQVSVETVGSYIVGMGPFATPIDEGYTVEIIGANLLE